MGILLSNYLNPTTLSTDSVNLNLKLMRWRRLPQIDLSLIAKQKVLLCGAGTLGTYISRILLAWGCSNITFIDNGNVSYSNPVRQCLFKQSDALKPKAQIAANAIHEIFASANCKGYTLSIPMPGHCTENSRESRWLPTLLAKVYNKIVMNVALGFDSYLVMRHAHNTDDLACYFCSDVVAPLDSLSDRSLDEQCTVTRPGLAPIAAGLGCELFVNYLQRENTKKLFAEPLPHQIRGSLFDFENKCIKPVKSYNHCSACSEFVVEKF